MTHQVTGPVKIDKCGKKTFFLNTQQQQPWIMLSVMYHLEKKGRKNQKQYCMYVRMYVHTYVHT